MDPAELTELQRIVSREMKTRFPPGAIDHVAVLEESPEVLRVRVFIPASGGPATHAADLAAWEQSHRQRMEQVRRELSLRLPPARLLEFTFDDPDAPKIELNDDGTADQELSSREVVAASLGLLRSNYVFPEVAERAAAAVEARLAAGEYDELDLPALTDRLTDHLNEVCADKHLRLMVHPRGPRPGPPPGARPAPGAPQRPGRPQRRMGKFDNFGIHRVERLAGNVGYLDIRRIAVPSNAGPTIAAAMELVSGTEALIIDLRRNGGGAVEGVVLWCSYLLPEQTHLNDIFHADTGETRQFWSLPYVSGERYLDNPLYVLTGTRTFSGGEDFGYTLQALGRATVIGQASGGGAHPTRGFPVSASVHIAIPFARSVNPITGTNWQGTGILPDISVPEEKAFDVAYRKALEHVLSADVPPPVAEEAREALAGLPADVSAESHA